MSWTSRSSADIILLRTATIWWLLNLENTQERAGIDACDVIIYIN